MATGTFVTRKDKGITAQQATAWRYYGWPGHVDPSNTAAEDDNPISPVGEVRYIIGWMADQMSRMDWQVLIDGSASWSVTLPDGSVIRSDEEAEEDEPENPRQASRALLLKAAGWHSGVVRQVTTNLFVAGEFDYIAGPDEKWAVVSVIHPDRGDLLEESSVRITGLWPHPADPRRPDAPLFGVLPVLSDMDWLNRLSRSQSASRVSSRGIMGVAEGLEFANGGDFWTQWEAAVRARMRNPEDVSPVMLRGAADLIEQSGKGMKGLSWLIPDFPYDQRIDERMDKLVQRLAYGLPVPPEILLGMQAQSRATAFQVEENSYRAHIEPPANLVAAIPQQALSLVLEDVGAVTVEPDPTELLARHHSTTDTKDAFDRGAVSFAFLREALNIPPDAEPSEEDILLMERLAGVANSPAAGDPGRQAAEEPVNAAVGPIDGEPLSPAALDDLSEALAAIDNSLRLELSGSTQQATERARERIGARARSHDELRGQVPRTVPNGEVAAHLGASTLSDYGVTVADEIERAIEPLSRWWRSRLREAFNDVTEVLGADVETGLGEDLITRSVSSLESEMIAHVTETLDSPIAQPLSARARQQVVSIAGGADAGA